MKRIGNIYEKIYSLENLQLADAIASQGKSKQYGVKVHRTHAEANLQQLHLMLKEKTYRTSEYTVFKVYEPKERDVYRLPYFPDRITHHAIMNIMEPIFVSTFTADSYSCIKGKGIHAAAEAVRQSLKDVTGTQYCLKLDVKKFYPSVDHDILKQLLRRKLKDKDLLWLLDEIIDSAPGLPIGNYLSQYLANFYLTYFDHWIKEQKRVSHYFRYADDMVILSGSKPYLHGLLAEISQYLDTELRLQVKDNYQVFPVAARGIDFVGYRLYHTHVMLRKSIKKNFARMLSKRPNQASTASYVGWAKHCNSKHLLKKLLNHDSIQRAGDQSTQKGIYRRQDQDRQNTQPTDRGTRVPHRGLDSQAGHQAPRPADQPRWGDAGSVHRGHSAHGNDTTGTQGQIPFPDHNSKRK